MPTNGLHFPLQTVVFSKLVYAANNNIRWKQSIPATQIITRTKQLFDIAFYK